MNTPLNLVKRPLISLCVGLTLFLTGNTCFAAHSVSLYGQAKYPPGFKHFDYVNLNAPQGGTLNTSGLGNFEKFNPYTLKGLAADGLSYLVFETLAVAANDEADTMYGLLAEDIAVAADGLSVTYRLNPKAHFSNGDPVLASDVKYSFDTLTGKKAAPFYRQYYSDVVRLVVLDKRTVRAEFKRYNHELPLIMSQLPVFSRKWGAGKSFDKINTDFPIASGPYVVESFDLGKTVVYRRDRNYWGNEHPTRVGMFNFEKIRYRYYKDTFTRMEGLKAGEIDLIQENASKNWARMHMGRQWDKGELVKATFKHSNGAGWQGFVFNTRSDLFKDIRVRHALWYAMDFEWMNRQLFFNLYTRSPSYFSNSEMAATGTPQGRELDVIHALQQSFGSKVPKAIFDPIPAPPTTLPPHSLRENLRLARALLNDAGWTYRDGALRDRNGSPFQFEMMLSGAMEERATAPFARNLSKLGIQMDYRIIDAALLQRKAENFDFDMMWGLMGGSQSPGNELFDYFSSKSADEKGSSNLMGIKDPIADVLIEQIVQSKTREELVANVRVLDRILRLGYYIVPHFYSNVHRVSYRRTLDHPQTLPLYYRIEDWAVMTWWTKK